MADPLSPPTGNRTEDYPPPPPPLPPSSNPPSSSMGRRSPDRDRSPSPRRRSLSGGRYYDDRRSYREDDRYGRDRHSDRYDPRPYYSRDDRHDRYDRYDHRDRYDQRDRYDRYDNRDRYDDRRGRQRPRHRRPVDRGNDQERKTSTTIYCGNLPYDFLDRDVHEMFETFGRIKSITIPMDNVTSKNKGFAFIEFEDRRDAEDAFGKYDGFSVEGRRLRLDWDIGLSKKDEHRPRRPPGTSMDERRERTLGDPYAAPPPLPPPPMMDSRGYRRESPEPYRR